MRGVAGQSGGRGLPTVWWKVLPWALAAAVCLSRVYLGAHFPLDVAAGRVWACSSGAC
jgi:membrane-associated phospholipid phosphatase